MGGRLSCTATWIMRKIDSPTSESYVTHSNESLTISQDDLCVSDESGQKSTEFDISYKMVNHF